MNAFVEFLGKLWWQILIGIGIWFSIMLYLKSNPKAVMKKLEENTIRVDANPPVYLKKIKWANEWRIIHPIVKLETIPTKEDGEFDFDADWSNIKYDKTRFFFGSKRIALTTLIIIGIVGLAVFGIYNIISSYQHIVSNVAVQTCLNQSGIYLG